MSSESAVTISKMLESLPEQLKEQVVEHLRKYIAELKNEKRKRDMQAKAKHCPHLHTLHSYSAQGRASRA
jgi:hypothetical protein